MLAGKQDRLLIAFMTTDPLNNDRQLIERWQNGDDSAFNIIYRQNAPKLKAFLKNRFPGASSEDLDDMVDETMLALLENKYRYKSDARISTYLYRIMSNIYIDKLRRDATGPAIIHFEDIVALGTEDESPEWEEEERADFQYDTNEADTILHQALELMGKSVCREIFQLQYWNKLTLKEIAIVLKLNETYVRRRVKICEKQLKKIVEQLRKENES